jgi:hypothetical protein
VLEWSVILIDQSNRKYVQYNIFSIQYYFCILQFVSIVLVTLVVFSICSGSMEFSVPAADPSTFFPISVGFSALNTFSSLKVGYIILLSDRCILAFIPSFL